MIIEIVKKVLIPKIKHQPSKDKVFYFTSETLKGWCSSEWNKKYLIYDYFKKIK